MYVFYPIQVILHFLFRPFEDIAVVTTNTFFVPLLATFFRRRNQKIVHLVYDLFPDALEISGEVHHDTFLAKILRFFTQMTFRRADANVFLGRHLKSFAESQYGKITSSYIIPVGSDHAPFIGFYEIDSKNITFLYCGNMGRMHDILTLQNYICETDNDLSGTRWVFHASGPAYGSFCSSIRSASNRKVVKLGGPLDDKKWVMIMRSAHVALITMKQDAERVVMPSKAYSAMMAGQAILAICPVPSDLSDLIVNHNCGWVVNPGDIDKLNRVVKSIKDEPEILIEKRRNAWNAAREYYSSAAVAHQWKQLFDRLCDGT